MQKQLREVQDTIHIIFDKVVGVNF